MILSHESDFEYLEGVSELSFRLGKSEITNGYW